MLASLDTATAKRLQEDRAFDAIVVGAGASGGLAAMLLTQAGLSVLALDAGWSPGFLRAPLRSIVSGVVRLAADERLQGRLPPSILALGRRALRLAGRIHQPVQSKCFAWELAPDALVNDRENPYVDAADSRFLWFRAHQVGGRMIIPGHGRQYLRLAEQDLRPDDGLSPSWCIEPSELSHWYDVVEGHLGLSGGNDHSAWVPDARLANTLPLNEAEAEVVRQVRGRWQGVEPILGRSAAPLESILAAGSTGRLSCRRGAIAQQVKVDAGGQACGVSWFDRETGRVRSARSGLVFLCASSLESTRILLSSGAQGSGGIGAASHALGRYLMDHVMLSAEGIGGALPGEPVTYRPGRCVYLPRFDLRNGTQGAGRGHGLLVYRWSVGSGKSYFVGASLGEMLPRSENRVVLDPVRRDAWGAPVLRVLCNYGEGELRQAADQTESLREMAELMGVRLHSLARKPAVPGTAIHECGTARMGSAPENSVVDPHNECWDARGLYVTDGSAFPSQGVQNPTLTIMALTARACDYAVRKRGST
jgi:choline dehydrogenase-like flavoprotein